MYYIRFHTTYSSCIIYLFFFMKIIGASHSNSSQSCIIKRIMLSIKAKYIKNMNKIMKDN